MNDQEQNEQFSSDKPNPQETNQEPEQTSEVKNDAAGDTGAVGAEETPPAAPVVKEQEVQVEKQKVKTPKAVVTKTQPDPVAKKDTQKPVIISTGVTGIAEVDKLIKDVPSAHQAHILRLAEYANAMAPKKPMNADEGKRHQATLYRTIVTIINREEQYFRQLFGALLAIFEEHKAGAFHETAVFRFMEHVELSTNDRKAFERLVNLIKVLSPKQGRNTAIKQISFENSLRFGLTEDGRQRVKQFFHVE